jgi:hypothetical protein
MTTFLLILMVLLLIAALERTNRRQSPRAPGLHGSVDHDDRDWARIKLDLLALGDSPEPITHKPMAPQAPPTDAGSWLAAHVPKQAQPQWKTNHRNGPRAA